VAGARNACAIDAHSQVYCWGDNSKGVLGQGLSTTDLASSSSPLRLAGLRADALALGRDFALALDASESGVPALLAWGQNTFGALGTFDFTPSLVPINAAAVVLDAGLRIVSGPLAEHVCAPQGATLACWGANPLGELGDGTRTDRARPTPTLGSILPVDADGKLALGKAHTCAIDAQGALWCWGANQRHQLGAAVTDSVSPSPVRVY
jgi:alpha-tubulin suppressor-like RCC1 family protein